MLAERVNAALEALDRMIAARAKLEEALAEVEQLTGGESSRRREHVATDAGTYRQQHVPAARPNGQALPERVCRNEHCQKPFTPKTGRQFYCTSRCSKTHNERKRQAQRRSGKEAPVVEEPPFPG
jgi:hypothetical protein